MKKLLAIAVLLFANTVFADDGHLRKLEADARGKDNVSALANVAVLAAKNDVNDAQDALMSATDAMKPTKERELRDAQLKLASVTRTADRAQTAADEAAEKVRVEKRAVKSEKVAKDIKDDVKDLRREVKGLRGELAKKPSKDELTFAVNTAASNVISVVREEIGTSRREIAELRGVVNQLALNDSTILQRLDQIDVRERLAKIAGDSALRDEHLAADLRTLLDEVKRKRPNAHFDSCGRLIWVGQ